MKNEIKIKYFSMFTGVGGFELGFEKAKGAKKFKCVGFAEIDKFANNSPTESVLYTHLADRLNEIEIDADLRLQVLSHAETAIATIVIPAYESLRDFLADQETRATDEDGVWKFPDGARFYAHQLRHHTTTELTSKEIHRLGLAQVEQNLDEMRAMQDMADEMRGLIEERRKRWRKNRRRR